MRGEWEKTIKESSLEIAKDANDLCKNLMDSVVKQLDEYLDKNKKSKIPLIGISIGDWPKTKEFEADFYETQKTWSTFHNQFEKNLKDHDRLCVKLENLRDEVNATERIKIINDHSKSIENSKTYLQKMENNREDYQKDMTRKFIQIDQFEENRMKLLKDVFNENIKLIKNGSKQKRRREEEQTEEEPKNFQQQRTENENEYLIVDLQRWSDRYGIGVQLNLPQLRISCEQKLKSK